MHLGAKCSVLRFVFEFWFYLAAAAVDFLLAIIPYSFLIMLCSIQGFLRFVFYIFCIVFLYLSTVLSLMYRVSFLEIIYVYYMYVYALYAKEMWAWRVLECLGVRCWVCVSGG